VQYRDSSHNLRQIGRLFSAMWRSGTAKPRPAELDLLGACDRLLVLVPGAGRRREALEHERESVTAALDKVYGDRASSLDPALARLQAATLPKDEW
jgi:hypothetical protein